MQLTNYCNIICLKTSLILYRLGPHFMIAAASNINYLMINITLYNSESIKKSLIFITIFSYIIFLY